MAAAASGDRDGGDEGSPIGWRIEEAGFKMKGVEGKVEKFLVQCFLLDRLSQLVQQERLFFFCFLVQSH